jgi:hypothetical protein
MAATRFGDSIQARRGISRPGPDDTIDRIRILRVWVKFGCDGLAGCAGESAINWRIGRVRRDIPAVAASLRGKDIDDFSANAVSDSLSPVTQQTAADVPSAHSGYLTALAVGTLAVASQLFTNVYPVFMGAIAAAGRASPAQLGRLATVEYLALTLGAMFSGKLLAGARLRTVAIVAGVVQLAAVGASTLAAGDWLLPVRAFYAYACGIHLWIMYEFVARSRNPGRLVGVCTAVVVSVAVVASWLASNFVAPAWGVNGVILFFGLPGVIAILGSFSLPNTLSEAPNASEAAAPAQASFKIPLASVWLLLSVFAWSGWISILWVYVEPVARALEIPPGVSQASVLTALSCSLIGAVAGAATAARLSAGGMLTIGLGVGIVQGVSLLSGIGPSAYLIGFGTFGFFGYFLVPFFVKALAAADVKKQAVVFFPGAQYAGGSIAPLIVSFVVSPEKYRGGIFVALASIVIAILCAWIGLLNSRTVAGSAEV